HPALFQKFRHDLTDHFLHEEPSHSCTSVNGGQDEDRFEHDGKVVPVGHQPLHEGNGGEDVGHAHGEGYCAARPPLDFLLNRHGKLGKVDGGHSQFCINGGC